MSASCKDCSTKNHWVYHNDGKDCGGKKKEEGPYIWIKDDTPLLEKADKMQKELGFPEGAKGWDR